MSISERDRSILVHMVKYCDQVDAAILHFGRSQSAFTSNVVYQNAAAMCLLQIGELAGHLSEEYRSLHPQVPWRQIKALRNIIAHYYGSVDAETAWEIIETDLPALRRFCEGTLREQ